MKTQLYATEEQYTKLQSFRQACFECLGSSRDTLFELGDAVLLTPSASSFVQLSLSPMFRRRWSSIYEALQDGNPDRNALLKRGHHCRRMDDLRAKVRELHCFFKGQRIER